MREDDAGRAGTTSAAPVAPAGAEAALLEAALPPCYTPQQVRFTDRRGTLWTVRCAHRLATVGDAPPAGAPAGGLPIVDDRRIDDEGFRIAACRSGRCWLEFTADGRRRRLRLVPPRWYALSSAALALLCEEAEEQEA